MILEDGTTVDEAGKVQGQKSQLPSVRFNLLGLVPLAQKLFGKKEKVPEETRTFPPSTKIYLQFYDTLHKLRQEKEVFLRSVRDW